ncbi:hypothetical protein [Rhizobium sp. CCGE 510]|uniref:hypothetical protein n=1 Tax=Rhizobium sp. CCGE 510 TaxID=1132836 RepID=UPI00027B7EAD|nr:hypothetical protein [Rhizobium sp. CCGE 510]EJT04435.1 hypothetical protein RCCGE510_15437 [Rhizobium sp. CCGE 510]
MTDATTTSLDLSSASLEPPTLSRWRHLMQRPLKIQFARMMLIGSDEQGELLNGEGHVEFPDDETIVYHMRGTSDDIQTLLSRRVSSDRDRYDARLGFRLQCVGADGAVFGSAWHIPHLRPSEAGDGFLICTGEVRGFWIDEPLPVAAMNSTEVAVHIQSASELDFSLHHLVRSGRTVHVFGEEIRFLYDRPHGTLWATVGGSGRFRFPFAENWLVEPFRILFAQLVYPRLIARNDGNGRAAVSVRTTSSFLPNTRWITLWSNDTRYTDCDGFWALYASILAFVVRSHEGAEDPDLDSTIVTELYEQIVLATQGSRWVWAMVIASSIENLLTKLMPEHGVNPSAKLADLEALSGHVRAWQGDANLRNSLLDTLARRRNLSPKNVLTAMKRARIISKGEFDAWEGLRNKSMHGNPISDYASSEADATMHELASLLHKVTLAVVNRVDLDFTFEEPRNTAADRITGLASDNDIKAFQDLPSPHAVPLDPVEVLLEALARVGLVSAIAAVHLHVDYVAQRYRTGVPEQPTTT